MNADRYGPIIDDLLAEPRLMPLGPGKPNHAARPRLERLAQAFDHVAVRDQDMANCCRAALWLYHDFLDESHALSQEIPTSSGSYWHAILHRREPDYGNSKYWFRRVGRHPVFEPLAPAAAELADCFASGQEWDPFAFVDRCEQAGPGDSPQAALCRQVQQREWELLFDYCYRQATGG
jgi:hypothetical protein